MDIKLLFSKAFKNILIALPYAFFISILMSIGGLVQSVFVSFFMSDEVNLYDMLNEGVIVHPFSESNQSIIQQILSFQITLLIPSLLIIMFYFHEKSIKQKLLYSSFFVFLTLTFFDLYLYFFDTEGNINEHIFSSILSNLIGSLVIILFLFIAIDIQKQISKFLKSLQFQYYKLIGSLSIIIFSIIVTSILLYIYTSVYTVTRSNLELIIKPPIQGFYGNKNKKDVDNKQFGLFNIPNDNDAEKIFFEGWVQDGNKFSIEWKKGLNKTTEIYNIEVRLIDGQRYPDRNSTNKLLLSSPTYEIKNIQNIKVSIEHNGSLGFQIMPKELKESGSITYWNKNLKQFNINEKDEKLILSNFLYYADQLLKHISWDNEVSYVISLVNIDDKSLISTKINISTDQENLEMKLSPDNNMTFGKKKIHQVFARSKNSVYKTENFMNGIILTFRKVSEKPTSILNALQNIDYKNETLIKGLNGWMSIDGVTKKDLSLYFNDGTLRWLLLHAYVEGLTIDGEEYNQLSKFSNEFSFIGDTNLTGEILDKGFLRFNGSSNAIYINRKRANLTRWEKLNIDTLYILGIFGAIIIFILNRLKYIMREELGKN